MIFNIYNVPAMAKTPLQPGDLAWKYHKTPYDRQVNFANGTADGNFHKVLRISNCVKESATRKEHFNVWLNTMM